MASGSGWFAPRQRRSASHVGKRPQLGIPCATSRSGASLNAAMADSIIESYCQKAFDAWNERKRYRRAAKERWKHKKTKDATHLQRRSTVHATHGQQQHATHMQGTGTGTGKKRKDAAGAASAFRSEEADLFHRGKAVLGDSAGGLIKNLIKATGSIALARAAIETASTSKTRANTSPAASTGARPPRSSQTAGIPGYDRRSGDFERPPHRSSINQRRPVLHDMSTMLTQAQSPSPPAQMPRSDDRSRRCDVGLQSLRMDRRRTLQ